MIEEYYSPKTIKIINIIALIKGMGEFIKDKDNNNIIFKLYGQKIYDLSIKLLKMIEKEWVIKSIYL